MTFMSREEKLADFVAWAQQHITGDEKGQAQILDATGQPRTTALILGSSAEG